MALIAIDLNDATLAGVGPDGPLLGEPWYVPGYAATVDGQTLFGAEAWRQARLHPRSTTNRFWHEFSEQDLTHSFGPFPSSADIVHAHLQRLLAEFGERPTEVLFTVPPYWNTRQLGLLLGVAEDLGLPVRGLVDRAVAATRGEFAEQQLLHVDASLHELTITRLEQQGRVTLGARQSVPGVGITRLEQACATFIAGRFLAATRFDPLHDARSEQFLYDSLYTWLGDLGRQDEVGVRIDFGGNEFLATIRRDELAQKLADTFEPAARQMRSSIGAADRVAIQISTRLGEFPGIVDVIDGLPQTSVFMLEPAAAALGALQRVEQFAPADAGIGLTTSLAWDRAVARPIESSAAPGRAREIVEPTHLLHDNRVYRLGVGVFNIGAELAPGEFGLKLGGSQSGVSRRHCSIRRGDNGVELVDHSRFGTQLNGHAITEAALLQAGDVIGIGSPPLKLHLVREVGAKDDGHGA